MTNRVRLALGLWAVLAVVVFNVTFDWQTRVAGYVFADAQVQRHRHWQPVATINEGFWPMVGAAARQSGIWLALILGTGVIATAGAARLSK
jgi:hypothetical protein